MHFTAISEKYQIFPAPQGYYEKQELISERQGGKVYQGAPSTSPDPAQPRAADAVSESRAENTSMSPVSAPVSSLIELSESQKLGQTAGGTTLLPLFPESFQ